MRGSIRPLSCLLFLWGLTLWLGLPVLANEGGIPVPHIEQLLIDLTFGQLMLLLTNLGLGGIVFVIWLYDMRNLTSRGELLERYDKSQAAHLKAFETISTGTTEAFKQINERNTDTLKEIAEGYRDLASQMHEMIAANIQVQTQVVDGLERVARNQEKTS